MQAGRELDALVAEKIMLCDYEVYWCVNMPYVNYGKMSDDDRETHGFYSHSLLDKNGLWALVPRYSTSIEASWQVVEKMAKDGWDYNLEWKGATRNYAFTAEGHFAKWVDGYHMSHHAVADTVPLHICLAALAAVGVEVA